MTPSADKNTDKNTKRKYVKPVVETLNEEEMLARFQVSTGSISWWD